MLPASKAASRPSNTGPRRNAPPGYRIIEGLTAMLMTYTVIIGWGLLGGYINADGAYWRIALACLVPAGAYMYGFIKTSPERDFGLLLSSIGWTFAALALMVQHGAVQSVYREAAPGDFIAPIATARGTLFFTFLAFAFILAGAVLSIQIWNRSLDRATR